MIISYAMFLPFLFEDGIRTIWLFWVKHEDIPRDDTEKWDGVNHWTNLDGTPIAYDREADLFLHFLWWVGFWAFYQLKVFKLTPTHIAIMRILVTHVSIDFGCSVMTMNISKKCPI